MNTFGVEIYDDEGKYCTFYTVRWLDTELSETDKFFEKFRNDERLKGSLKELAVFLESVIANKYGARKDFFRFENMASALPPSREYKVEKVNISYNNFPLRLYCLRISDSLVSYSMGVKRQHLRPREAKRVWHLLRQICLPKGFWKHLN